MIMWLGHLMVFHLGISNTVMLFTLRAEKTGALASAQFKLDSKSKGSLSKNNPKEQSQLDRGTAGIRTQDLLFTRQAL